MDRKKTILIAVMINAGLLVVLFIAALSSQDEGGSVEIAQTPLSSTNRPLFPNEADAVLQQTPVAQEAPMQVPVVLKAPAAEMSPPPEVIPSTMAVHRLPQPAPEVVVAMPAAPSRGNTTGTEVTVKKGDNLEKIAKAHHTTVDEMIRLNQLPGSFLRIGQVLKIPEVKKTAQVAKTKPLQETATAASPEYYTIKVGDNPWGIAMKHHMKVEELLKLNHLTEEKARKLKPGERLRTR